MPEPETEPHAALLAEIAERLDLDVTGARPLRLHDASTFLLPADHIVVRLNTASDEALARATKAVQLTAWLSSHGFPTVRPAMTEPTIVDGHVATTWHAVAPQPASDTDAAHTALGHLIRDLHRLPDPPVRLPEADPLARIQAALDLDASRRVPVLEVSDHDFLTQRLNDLNARYRSMTFPLGVGLIHNDAHPGNLLADPSSTYDYLLTDWDSACIGPREMDVVLTGAPGSRFGDTETERQAFTTGYGYDIATWPHYQILRDIRDLHSLAGYIRAAPQHATALHELRIRVHSLRDNDRYVRWSTV